MRYTLYIYKNTSIKKEEKIYFINQMYEDKIYFINQIYEEDTGNTLQTIEHVNLNRK